MKRKAGLATSSDMVREPYTIMDGAMRCFPGVTTPTYWTAAVNQLKTERKQKQAWANRQHTAEIEKEARVILIGKIAAGLSA